MDECRTYIVIKEELLHFLWKHQLFTIPLKTIHNEDVKIIHPGWHNHDSGPDFTTAQIRIDNTLWAGNVEIHRKTSDWNKHNHIHDPAYRNIILHVVLENDCELHINTSTLEVKKNIPREIIRKYNMMMQQKEGIPCDPFIEYTPPHLWECWKNRLLIERFETKSEQIQQLLNKYKNNWEEVFYIMLSRSFGMRINSIAFELLAKSIPLNYLLKHKNNLSDIEALLFGQAGFLNVSYKDDYPNMLVKTYKHMKNKWGLIPNPIELWKFLRLRPANFPHIRIAQLAQIIHMHQPLFSIIRDIENPLHIQQLFEVTPSPYWENHFIFDKPSEKIKKTLGRKTAESITINTIIPMIFTYGLINSYNHFIEKAIEMLSQISPEENIRITQWKKKKIFIKTAADTQALIHLHNQYCIKKRCLHCAIGAQIIKN